MHRSHLVGLQQGEGLLHAAEKSGEDRWNGFRGKASRRLVASRQAKAINVTASFRRICDRTGSIWSVHR